MAVDCRDLADRFGVKSAGRRGGGGWQSFRCWNTSSHNRGDSTPSLRIGPLGYVCNGCGLSGDCFIMVGVFTDAATFPEQQAWLLEQWDVDLSPGAVRAATERARRPGPGLGALPTVPPLMRRIWALTGDPARCPLSDAASDWLRGRGLSPAVALALGCRDWLTVADDLQVAVLSATVGECVDAGLVRELDDGRQEAFMPFQRWIAGVGAPMLAFPIWIPGDPCPRSWRLRYLGEPPPGRPKCEALFGPQNGRGIPQIVGMVAPSAVEGTAPLGAHAVARPELPAPPVIVCEGEPDLLTVAECAGGRAHVIGLGAVGQCATDDGRLKVPELRDFLRGRDVAVMTHSTQASHHLADAVAAVARTIVAAHPPDKNDWNDRHQRGECSELVQAELDRLRRQDR